MVVFVDRFTKYVKFAPCTKSLTAKDYAKLFLENVFRNFGLPRVLISDRDPRFVSQFWQELFRIFGTDVRMSTAYHPQTDGQSEVTIRTLENFLRPYIEDHQKTWVDLLPLLEFAANNAVNASTGYSPFYLHSGQHPDMMTFASNSRTKVAAVEELTTTMRKTLADASTRFKAAQERMRISANKKRRDVAFKEGDEVLVTTTHLLPSNLAKIPKKLRRRWVGPFKVTKIISRVAYQLQLPEGWRAHNVFHVSKLKEYIRDEQFREEEVAPPTGTLEGDEDTEYVVEGILDHRGSGRNRKYLVKWEGYHEDENTWEPISHLTNARDMVKEYERTLSRDLGNPRRTRRSRA